MYKGFNLKLSTAEVMSLRQADIGDYVPIRPTISDSDMEKALQSESANWIMDHWFKNYGANVFLSHAHNDKDLARKIATYFTSVGLSVFIDSDVWGYVEDLQRKIDDKKAVFKRRDDGTVETYDYKSRNITTSHVHVLLAHALMRMIDQTECFIFLSTETSTLSCGENRVDTYSPWIFHELESANVVQIRTPPRLEKSAQFVATMDEARESLQLIFQSKTDRLRNINLKYIESRLSRYCQSSGNNPYGFLDMMYDENEDEHGRDRLLHS